jgi:hypothetical protein
MSRWRFNLRQSKNLALIGELNEASDKSLTLMHGTPGSANWGYPMSGRYAPVIQPFNTCISAERYNWRATQAMNLAGTPGEIWDWIWSGFVLPLDEDWTGDTMKIGCVGWAQRLAMRQLKRDKTYAAPAWDDGPIFKDLLDEMNLDHFPDVSNYPVPTVAGSDPFTPTWIKWGGMIPNEGPGGLTAYRARLAPISLIKTKNQFVLPIYDELSNIEDGADWWVHPKTRELFIYRKRCTSHIGTNYPAVVLAFKWGPNNLAQFSRNIAGDQKANYVLVTGSSGMTPGFDHNQADQAINGLIESLTQWTDAKGPDNTILMAEASAQIILRQYGKITYGITPFAYTGGIGAPPTSVPEPWVDYDPVGDEVLLKAVHPVRGDIPLGVVRSFGVTVTIDEENNGTLGQLQVAP